MTTKSQDIDLRKDVLEELEWDPSIDARTIGVAIENGIIALTGHVGSYADKTNAEKIVMRVHGEGDVDWHYQRRSAESAVDLLAGVRGVTNNVTVKARQARVEDVKDQIEAALKRNAKIDSKEIVVQTSDGRVTLSGTVRSWVERQDAVNAAWSAPGVMNVVDQIRIHA